MSVLVVRVVDAPSLVVADKKLKSNFSLQILMNVAEENTIVA